MIEVQQGTPGSGKSATAVARAISQLKRGGVVAANFGLVDGWADEVAQHTLLGRFSPAHRYDMASSFYQRFYRVGSLAAIRQIDPRSQAVGRLAEKPGKYIEGSGLLILDEAQLIFNSRNWRGNMGWIEFFTQHRKLGWNVILIAHTIEMIDSQIRPLAEYESRFRNLQKVHLPVIGVPVSPIPLFLVIRRYAGLGAGASVVADRDLFPLPLWAAKLYDSLHVFSADTWDKEGDDLPHCCGSPPVPPPDLGADRAPVRQRVSQLSPDCMWSMWEKNNIITSE
jgi:hypothetical protein